MIRVTAFLIVRDEERLLPRCLAALDGAVDEIVVLDCGSRDGTVRILEAAARDGGTPLRWHPHRFAGFGEARARALSLVRTPWAFWIDADELPGEGLRRRLRGPAAAGLADRDAWELPLVNRVRGRVMRGRNLAGQRHLRLFRAAAARISDSTVHEGVVLAPGSRVGRLPEPLLHDTLTDVGRYLRKVALYTRLEAAAADEMPAARRLLVPLHLLVTVPATLWREYLWRGGWRDGREGLLWAGITAWGSLRRDLAVLRRGWPRARGRRSRHPAAPSRRPGG